MQAVLRETISQIDADWRGEALAAPPGDSVSAGSTDP
jgi:hypothetical protein